MKTLVSTIKFERINNDVNGNPRYVFHYLELIPKTLEDRSTFEYEDALIVGRELGGKKFHNKQFGGGICVQSYNIMDDKIRILKARKEGVLYKNKYNSKIVLTLKDATNKKGNLKKWFKLYGSKYDLVKNFEA